MSQSRRQRANAQRDGRNARDRPRFDPTQLDQAVLMLCKIVGGGRWLPETSELTKSFMLFPQHVRRRAIDGVAGAAVEAVFDRGWTPRDVFEHLRRRGHKAAARLALSLIAARTATYPPDRVHPRWRAQIEGRDSPEDRDLEVRHLLVLLPLLQRLPFLITVMPRPGAQVSFSASTTDADEKVLRRIRALLAKAESTDFNAEAEALTAKAQELMSRYSIDHVPADDETGKAEPGVRRMWIDNPYVLPKMALVQLVAHANRCRTVCSDRDGFVTLLGFDTDLDLVELLVTSLLVQATRAMRQEGPQTGRYGDSHTKSFRYSFLLAYAQRVGERLTESADAVTADADERRGGTLVPVLDAREQFIDAAFAKTFPKTRSVQATVRNVSGYGAGRAAADHARLDVRRSVRGDARSA